VNDDDLERLLADSFDRQARDSVGDRSRAPRARFLDAPAAAGRRRTARALAPLAAAAAVVAVVVGIVVVQHGTNPSTRGAAAGPPAPVRSTPAASSPGPHTPVHVSLLNTGQAVVGVGMPVVAHFSAPITDARALARATRLTVNGRSARGAWYFVRSTNSAYPVEGHFRMASFWPADAKVDVQLPIKGLSAGKDYVYDDSLSLDFATGPAQIVTVDDARHDLVLARDGHTIEKVPVSLGGAGTPTLHGTKVIMEKGRSVTMKGPGYYDPHVQWTQRLTYSGEYLHAAPWNTDNIDHGIDTSNGCTNLLPGDAQRLYHTLRVGDVVRYPNAPGPAMTLQDGFGDWNVPWSTWLTGGLLPTS
jgi:lipoprotein-anchoring transpeptidase ErfK/SrfK